MRRLSVALGTLAALTILLGFLIQWMVITHFGPGLDTDALFASLAIPQMVVTVLSNPIGHVLVPLLATESAGRREAEAWTAFLTAAAGFGLLGGILIVTSQLWVPLTVTGFSDEGKDLTVHLARIHVLGMAFACSAAAARSGYHARHQFVWTLMAAVIAAAVAAAFLLWRLPIDGISAAAWSFTGRSALECALLLPGLGAFRRPTWASSFQRKLWGRAGPIMLGYSYERTDIVVDRLLASMAPAGGLSLLYLGQQVWGAVGQIVNRAVTLPVTPRLAEHAHAGAWSKFRGLYVNRLIQVVALTLLAIGLMALVGRPALELVFGIRNVTESDIRLLWVLMLCLFGLVIGDPSGHLLLTSFYARGDTTTPTWVGSLAYTLGIACKVGGFVVFGLLGLAAGTTAYYLIRTISLWVVLHRSTPHAVVKIA
jgi:peptidoglycan biosynthesis protein MviN/MurJ (putative lipid II flippase)